MLYLFKKNKSIILLLISVLVFVYLVLSYQTNIFKYLFPSKVWAHRVITIDKYKEVQGVFKGAELDLVFDLSKNNFEVNYPPLKSIGLTLVDFLKQKKTYNNFNIWLDFKNLNNSNYRQSAEKLESIVRLLNINLKNIIVESKKPFFLKEFSKKGFKTAYYLPSNISMFTSEDIVTTSKLIQSTNVDFISSDIKDYSFMKEYFPKTKIITWVIDTPRSIKSRYNLKRSIVNFIRTFRVLNDNNVEVVLVKFVARSGNR